LVAKIEILRPHNLFKYKGLLELFGLDGTSFNFLVSATFPSLGKDLSAFDPSSKISILYFKGNQQENVCIAFKLAENEKKDLVATLKKHKLHCEEKNEFLFISWNYDLLLYVIKDEDLMKKTTAPEEGKENPVTVKMHAPNVQLLASEFLHQENPGWLSNFGSLEVSISIDENDITLKVKPSFKPSFPFYSYSANSNYTDKLPSIRVDSPKDVIACFGAREPNRIVDLLVSAMGKIQGIDKATMDALTGVANDVSKSFHGTSFGAVVSFKGKEITYSVTGTTLTSVEDYLKILGRVIGSLTALQKAVDSIATAKNVPSGATPATPGSGATPATPGSGATPSATPGSSAMPATPGSGAINIPVTLADEHNGIKIYSDMNETRKMYIALKDEHVFSSDSLE
jgi:hypothetical protein